MCCSTTASRAAGSARAGMGDHAGDGRGRRQADEQQGPGPRRRARSATSRAAATRWASAACSASASSPTTRPTTWPASCSRRVDGLLYGCGDAVIGVNPATDRSTSVAAILHGLDRLIERLRHPDAGLLPGPHHHAARGAASAARRSICCSSRSPAREAANASFGVTLALLARGPRARCWSTTRTRPVGWVGDERDVLRDRPGQRPVGGRPPRRRSAHAGGPRLRRGPGVRPVPGQQRRRLHRPGVPRTTSGRSSRAGLEDHFMGKLLGLPMGCRRLLHQPRRRRPELGRQPARCCSPRRAATTSWACPAPTT